jgi:octaprenyl-diphosphate synthase
MDTTILASIADYEGAIEKAVNFAQSMLREAVADLICLDDTPYKQAFEGVAAYVHGLLDNCRALSR